MSDVSSNKLIVDHDFVSIHADGLKIKYDGMTCRLIFYQKTLDVKNNEINKDYAKTLKFEVIITFDLLQKIDDIIRILNERGDLLAEASRQGKTDHKTIDAWQDYWKESSTVFYDTDEVTKTEPDVQKKLLYFLSILRDMKERTDGPQ